MTLEVETVRKLRGKSKFLEGEKVLCFEPDPNKAKVVYEAKILEVVNSQCKKSGKRQYEYLGRYVLEDMLLKDSDENRALQQELKKEAEDFQAKLNKKKRAERRLSDKVRESVDSVEGGVGARLAPLEDPDDGEIQFGRLKPDRADTAGSDADTDTMTEPSTSPSKSLPDSELEPGGRRDLSELIESAEDCCTEAIPLNLPESFKRRLEQDQLMVNSKRKLLSTLIVRCSLLEMFVRNYAIRKLAGLEKQLSKETRQYNKLPAEREAEKYEDAVHQINICKEVAEGVRIIIDFHLGNILLYRREEEQYSKAGSLRPVLDTIEREEGGAGGPGQQPTPPACDTQSECGEGAGPGPGSEPRTRKRSRHSTVGREEGSSSTCSGTVTPTLTTPGTAYPQSNKSHAILGNIYSWKLVPETVYFQSPVPSSLVYGGIHLARLLVTLPDILLKMRFTVKNCKNINEYLNLLVEFINNQQESIFADNNYA